MDIVFENPTHERLVNNFEALSRRFDRRDEGAADNILMTLTVLLAAPCLAEVPRSFRPHPLKGDLKGQFAVNVDRTHRIIFRPDHDADENFRIDNYKTITSIRIVEIFKDYH